MTRRFSADNEENVVDCMLEEADEPVVPCCRLPPDLLVDEAALPFFVGVVVLGLLVLVLGFVVDGLEPRVTLCVCAEMVVTASSKTKIANMLFIL